MSVYNLIQVLIVPWVIDSLSSPPLAGVRASLVLDYWPHVACLMAVSVNGMGNQSKEQRVLTENCIIRIQPGLLESKVKCDSFQLEVLV